MIDYKAFIEINPEIRFGKPCIKGMRIAVQDVLGWLASGMSVEDIIKDFPQLKDEQIRACLAYVAGREHRVKVAT